MPFQLQDMSLRRGAIALSGSQVSEGTRALINAIIAEENASVISADGGAVSGSKRKFFNHTDDKDPATNGGDPSGRVLVEIDCMPSSRTEHTAYEVVVKSVGLLSGRRRLAVRREGGEYSFWRTGHPKNDKPGLRTNVHTGFSPFDPAR